ncbi:hypothetical protein OAD66_04280 [Bacteroidia bacterium]|nr:hypothetical protein [Bacteroidia bacterium]
MENQAELTNSTKNSPEGSLVLTDNSKYYIGIIGKWANFLSILMFILCGFIVIAAISFFVFTSFIPTPSDFPFPLWLSVSFIY